MRRLDGRRAADVSCGICVHHLAAVLSSDRQIALPMPASPLIDRETSDTDMYKVME